MELKIWVEGIQRIVCGVTDQTTCQDIVFALAHATNRTGRFTLIERWRNNERLLAPNESPLKILMKWGEYSNDVQFILQRSEKQASQTNNNNSNSNSQPPVQSPQQILRQQQKAAQQNQSTSINNNTSPLKKSNSSSNDKIDIDWYKDSRKALNLSSSSDKNPPENVGIVKGIPQKSNNITTAVNNANITINKNINHIAKNINAESNYATKPYGIAVAKNSDFSSADVRSSLDHNLKHDSDIIAKRNNFNGKENLLESYNMRNQNSMEISSNSSSSAMIEISSNGALAPPPYRNPPSPTLNQKVGDTNQNKCTQNFNYSLADINDLSDVIMQNSQYRGLIQLIKYQREKLSTQQLELTKFDAEIVYLESKERDQIQQLEAITQEISKADQTFRQGNEQLQTLHYVEEESELVCQQEKTMKAELTLLRSKLANCETELLQYKNKIRLLVDEIEIEQQNFNRQYENRQQLERHLMSEVDRLQAEIEIVLQSSENYGKTADNLKKEVAIIETSIAEKKKCLEKLVQEMKEVNLKSLAVGPAEEIRHLLDSGSIKPGSSRRIIGSPRQLENAVPTSKNPHGVWV